MKLIKRVLIGIAALVLACGIGYGVYYLVHYYFYDDYKDLIKATDELEEGTEFTGKSDSNPSVTGDGWTLADESDELKLYINTATTDVAVYDKRSGEITYSNPQEEDTATTPVNQNIEKSQLVIYYMDRSNNPVTKGYNTYEYATSFEDQVKILQLSDGIRVEYQIGDFSNSTIIPTSLLKERYEELTAQMDADNVKTMEAYYDVDQSNSNLMSINGKLLPAIKRKLNVALESVGYTEADYEKDMEDAGVESEAPVSFTAAIEYRLDGDSLVMNVPTSEMTEAGGAQIYQVDVLNFFGAGNNTEEGYMVVPNGSGSLINFNNGKTNVQSYMQYVYGMDVLSSSNQTATEHTDNVTMPIFGIVHEKSAVLAVIEDGASLASLTANVAGKTTSYNNVYASFTLRYSEKIEMDGGSMTVVQPDFIKTNIQIRYSFMDQDNCSYSGLAQYYRNYLIEKGDLTENAEADTTTEDIPLYVDLLGGVKYTAFFLGAQYLSVEPMTTYKQANTILDTLSENDINRVVVNYQGWFNGGYYHNVADRINLVDKLGTKKQLEALSDRLEENDGKLYGDVAFQEVTSISKRYMVSTETSRYYGNGHVAIQGRINPTTFRATSGWGYDEVQYYLISPKYLNRYTTQFSNKITRYDITGISLRDLASDLQSDSKRTESINREEALDIVENALATVDATDMDVMESAANAYAWKYADDLINIPMSDNDFFIVDEEIPFYQMVIHGCISYASDSINLSSDYDKQAIILDCVETGSAPHFTYTYEDATEMKYTGLNNIYSSTFSNWVDDTAEIYSEVNEALCNVENATIVNHEEADGVTTVTYSNGVKIYVNRNADKTTVDGIEIPGNDYVVGGVK